MPRSARRAAAAALALLGTAVAVTAGPRELPKPPRPDFDVYLARIAPWIEAKCAGCHRAGGGSFRLDPVSPGRSEEERRRDDFLRVTSFVDSDAPWDSRLLVEVLDPSEGGGPHAGGSFLRVDDEDYDTLLDFASGATMRNLPPETWLPQDVRGRLGEAVVVDGRGSYDRDREDSLVYRWEIVAAPPGSRVALADASASRAEFTPDVGGSYVLRLRVGDGKVWSAPRSTSVEVFEQVVEERGDPAALSGLEKADPDALRRLRRLYLDVLGRPPTPAEALAEERIPVERLVDALLARAEAGRAWYEEACARLGLFGDFRPAGEVAEGLPLRIASEGTPPHEAEAALALDPAFLRAHPPGRALADAVAGLLLSRAPTDAEIEAARLLASGAAAEVPGLGPVATPADWVRGVVRSPEFRRAAVRRRLERFMPSGAVDRRTDDGVAAAGAGAAAWHGFLRSTLLSSDVQERRTLRRKDDLTFLRSLFVDLLERKPTDRELVSLARAAAVLPGRSAPLAAVVKVLLDSGQVPLPLLVDIPDAPKWIADRFLRYLGRRPSAAEVKAYGEVLLHPAGGPDVVVRAILTGPEYACR